jgi:hypothetical protein
MADLIDGRRNSSRVTPRCLVQYLTSRSSVIVILLRSGTIRVVTFSGMTVTWLRLVVAKTPRHAGSSDPGSSVFLLYEGLNKSDDSGAVFRIGDREIGRYETMAAGG